MSELRLAAGAGGENLRGLLNLSGREYRRLGIASKLGTMSHAEALELLVGNGHLVKRPFAICNGVTLVGFSEEQWRAALTKG